MSGLIGQHLGQYDIVSLLGKGGMATVYRARQESMGRDVAVKVIKPDLAETGDFLARFEREARTVAALSHPYILKVFDYGQHGDLVYLAMELLEGGSLTDEIRRGPLSLDRVSRTLDHISQALDYAHKRGIIHRDLKPQNVLLDEEGNAHLSDFGIAKLLSASTALTQSGVAMGTPSYMPPEQWQGRGLDARADIYALGIMLFEMLSGQLPFNAETPFSMMHMHVNEPPSAISTVRKDLPAGVDAVIAKALAKDPQNRYSSAGELNQAFKAALTASAQPAKQSVKDPVTQRGTLPPTQAPKATVRRPSGPSAADATILDMPAPVQPRNRLPLFGVAGLIVAVVLIGGLLAVLSRGSGQPSTTPSALPTITQLVAMVPSSTPVSVVVASTAQPTVEIIVPTTTPVPATTTAPLAVPTTAVPITAVPPTVVPAVANTQAPLPTNTEITQPTVTIVSAAVNPTGTAVAALPNNGAPAAQSPAMSISNAAQIKQQALLTSTTDRVISVAFSPDGTLVASGGGDADKSIRLWDVKTGQVRTTLQGHGTGVAALQFSPDGKLLASGSWDHDIRLWDISTGKTLLTLQGHTAEVLGVAFSPDGSTLASAGQDRTVRLWDVKTGQSLAVLKGHTAGLTGVAFSPDGTLVASAAEDNTARLWDVKTGKAVFVLKGHTAALTNVAFSPDGSLVATGAIDNTARLWDVKTGKSRTVLKGHDSGISSVAFSPDGTVLATGSWDHDIRLWNVQTGEQLTVLTGHTQEVYGIAFNMAGTLLVSGSVDASVRLWGIPAGS